MAEFFKILSYAKKIVVHPFDNILALGVIVAAAVPSIKKSVPMDSID